MGHGSHCRRIQLEQSGCRFDRCSLVVARNAEARSETTKIGMGAATVAPTSVVVDLFATLLRVRQAELAVRAGYEHTDAWDTGVAEPGVDIDTHTEFA